jgi:hypothetical protein
MSLLTFNLLLQQAGIDPSETRLLRHETKKHRGRTPYSLWRDGLERFERYQDTQLTHRRSYFTGKHWASFVVTPDGKTLFVGLYDVQGVRSVPANWYHELNDDPLDPSTADLYSTSRNEILSDYRGRLVVSWGVGTRTWVQRADKQSKPIVELRSDFVEPAYPGHAAFIEKLSDITAMPLAWRSALLSVKGVYLLTCPRTKEQYVGSATGSDGFFGRWQEYLDGKTGGNIGLASREPSDYQVSILEVAGSADDRDAIIRMEALWKRKLQSREMGLNRN